MEDDHHIDNDFNAGPAPTKAEIDADAAAQVNFIMLSRVYDVLWLMLAAMDPDTAARVADAHKKGFILGPNPAYRPSDPDE